MTEICRSKWSCSNERHRTTNALERWYFRVNKKVGKSNLFQYIHFLKSEAKFYEKKEKKLQIFADSKKKRSRYIQKDAKVQKIIEDLLKGSITAKECLQKLCWFK